MQVIDSIKLFILIFITSSCIACKGQDRSETTPANTSGVVVSKLPENMWSVFQDSKSNYWFCSNGEGLYRYDGKAWTVYTTFDGLVDDQVRGIQEDHEGNIYVESFGGVTKLVGDKFIKLPILESSDGVWKMEATDLWFNTNYKDVYRYDGQWLHKLSLPKQQLALLNDNMARPIEEMRYSPYSVFGLNKDLDGNLWIGTSEAGAFRFDGQSFVWFGESELSTLPDGRVPGVRSMIQDKDGYFWLSNFYSKYKVDPALPKGYEKVKAVEIPEELTKDRILYFNAGIRDKAGNLWMTTYHGGVWKYDGETLSNQQIHNGFDTVLLLNIYEDNEGVIWLGTQNDGIYRQEGDSFSKYQVEF